MRKSKKLLAFLTALSISASAFAGLATTAFAADKGIDYSHVTGKISITYDEEKAARLIIAKYNADKALTSVKTQKVTLKNGTKEVTKTLAEGDVVMVWDSLEGMQPMLLDKFIVPADPRKTILDEKLTSDSVTNPTDGSYTWGDISSLLADKKGLLLSNGNNKDNNYDNKDIVTFTNPVGDTGNKIDISYNLTYQGGQSKGQAYTDYKMSYYNDKGKFMFSITESIGNWADKAIIEYANSETTTAKEELPGHLAKNQTTSVSAEVKFGTNCGYLTIDGKMYRFVTDGTLKKITAAVSGGQDFNRGIYITNYKMMTEPTVLEEYCLVTYDIDGTIYQDSVVSGNSVAADNVPSTDKRGYIFDGWQMGTDTTKYYTTDEVKAMKITSDTAFKAVHSPDTAYVQSIASVDFVDTTGAVIAPRDAKAHKYPTEAEAVEYKPYEVKVTSDIGKDITADCQITWSAVGGGGIDANYFQFVEKTAEDDTVVASKRYVSLRQGGESWFGYIKADVVYDPANSDDETKNTTGSAQIPCAAVSAATESNRIMPAPGYPTSMDYYVDDIVDYVATSDDYSHGYDPVLNNWCIVGSNPERDLLLVKDDSGKKALKFTNQGGNRGGSSSSCVGTYSFPAQSAQYVFETIVKFDGNTRIGVYNKTTNQTGLVTEWAVSYDGSALTAGEGKIAGIEKGTWYKLVVTSDPANKLYSVYAYNTTDGTLIGSIKGVEGDAAGGYLCIDGGFPVYINSIQAYTPTVGSVSLTADPEVVGVPEEGEAANEVKLVATCLTEDGLSLTGGVDWSLEEEYEGVEIVKGTQTATLKITAGASGTIKVSASMGGKRAEKEITVTSSKDRVAFTTKASSITIPFEGEDAVTADYLADTITPGSPNGTNDKNIEYTFLDKTGAAVLETLPKGVTSSVDPETNKLTLTVAAGATPAIFYIKATQKGGDGLSAKTQVNVHGQTYSFGTTVEEGDTQVTAASLYNDTIGYGFEATTGLTDAADKVTGTEAYKFKAKVPNGNYKVTVSTTSASMKSEIVDSLVTSAVKGISKSGSNFNVAICDGVLDLTFDANSSISSLSISQISKPSEREKPKVYAIGDSTTQNSNGGNLSWGSYTANNASAVPAVFSSFSNNGKSGADSVSFYNSGLIEAVLLDICPGDYVSVNMGINHNRDGDNECAAYVPLMSKYYIEAIQERGGIPIITAATPLGFDGSTTPYSNGKFECTRGNDAHNTDLRNLAKEYNLNIIELGVHMNDVFNALTMDDVTAYNSANNTSYTTVLDMVKSWWGDHNHYKAPLAKMISEYMLESIADIASDDYDGKFSWTNDPLISK